MRNRVPSLLSAICLPLCLAGSLAGSLAGCGVSLAEPAGALVAASAVAIPVFGRSVPDLVYSGITGQDCSIVRLEQGRSYCRTPDPPIPVAPVCSRSLGTVDCWANPEAFATPPRGIADAPAPTPEQEAWRTRRWPSF